MSLLAAVGCEASIGGVPLEAADASTTLDSTPVVSIDAAPQCFNGRVVYLNFDGVTLTDAAASDATQNRASWMTIASGTAPPFQMGNGNRQLLIDQIRDGIRGQLASFPITVVTTRPASGPYVMLVYGGVANQVGSRYGAAVNELDCDDSERSDVAWLSDNLGSVQRYINVSIGAIGFGLGLTATSDPLDCMCGWANGCAANNNVACKLSPSIARDPGATQLCGGVTMQDEVATFSNAFCK